MNTAQKADTQEAQQDRPYIFCFRTDFSMQIFTNLLSALFYL